MSVSLRLGLAAGLGLFMAGALVGFLWPEPVEVVFVSVGQGDCAVLRDGGEAILIDDGPATPYGDAGAKLVLPELRALGVDDVQAIFLSHPDGDHVGGTSAILKAFPSARLVMSDQFEGYPAMEAHLANWGLRDDRVVWLPRDDAVLFGPFEARVSCPDLGAGEADNNGSMFMRFGCGGGSIVFSGDAPASVERLEEVGASWGSEILHVGHHGSRTSTDPSWLAAVRPRYGVISVGRNNVYGHPAAEVVRRLESAGVRVWRTDRDGTVRFRFDGRSFVPE